MGHIDNGKVITGRIFQYEFDFDTDNWHSFFLAMKQR